MDIRVGFRMVNFMSRDAFDLARSVAAKSDPMITKYQHASVILDRKGRIIAHGKNHYAGHLTFADDGLGIIRKTVHSEIDALSKVNIRRLEDATIINYARTNVSAILAMPCENCWPLLRRLGFKKVFYTIRSMTDAPTWKESYF